MQAYSALRVAAQAISDAKSAESGKIRDAIKNLNMDMTPFGPIRFDAIGQNQHPVLITQVQGGKYPPPHPPPAPHSTPTTPAPPPPPRPPLPGLPASPSVTSPAAPPPALDRSS